MKILPVNDVAFRKYGRVVKNVEVSLVMFHII